MMYCYPVPAKAKSLNICETFAYGCRGTVVTDGVYRPGGAFFCGVVESMRSIWEKAIANNDYWYCDNSYFDRTRKTHFRITHNRLQHTGLGTSDCRRFKDLDIPIHPWKHFGDHVLVCQQSRSFMHMPVGYVGDWMEDITQQLKAVTSRALIARGFIPSKLKASKTLTAQLHHAYATVAWSSAACIESVLRGIPIVSHGASASSPMSGTIATFNKLPYPSRNVWAGILADNQWTLEEIKYGTAWAQLRKKNEN